MLRISSAIHPHIWHNISRDVVTWAAHEGRPDQRSLHVMQTLSIPKFTLLISIALLAGLDIQTILILLSALYTVIEEH